MNGRRPTTLIVPNVKKIRGLNLPEPLGPPRPVADDLYLYLYLHLTITPGTKTSRRSLGICRQKSAVSICGSFGWKRLHIASQSVFCVKDRLRLKIQLSIEGIIQRITTGRQHFINT